MTDLFPLETSTDLFTWYAVMGLGYFTAFVLVGTAKFFLAKAG